MDIGSNGKWPGCALSNFAAHEFEIDGVKCASMEGFLQSLKHKNPDMQREICSYVGIKAKRAGGTHWMRHQKLYWKGVAYVRTSHAYQDLLDRAYDAAYYAAHRTEIKARTSAYYYVQRAKGLVHRKCADGKQYWVPRNS